jgi:DNA helicase II / ATP-dependent DNA helicase PcrA
MRQVEQIQIPSPQAIVRAAPVALAQVRQLLVGLNRQQRQAVTHGEGPLLVVAGPGTGKTEVITRRAAWLIATKRALPREILALTFSHKAAAEMQARVDVLVPYGQADTAIHTFHAFGDRLLREHALELGLPGDVRLISRPEAMLLLRQELFSLGLERYRPLGDPGRFLGALVDLIGRAKEEGVGPDAFAAHVDDLSTRAAAAGGDGEALADLAQSQSELARAYARYQALLSERGLIDHADQVLLGLRLLRERAHIRRALHERYRYVLVDEFQDTNRSQLELLLALAGRRNVTVVGDDDQAIYAFRGAAVDNLRRLAAAYPDLRRVVLTRNYRSLRPIIDASQRLIRHNEPGRLAAHDGIHKSIVAHRRTRRPPPVRAIAHATRDAEADAVAREIAQRVMAGDHPRDFSLLVRTNADADHFVRSLLVENIPVRALGRRPLRERSEGRALLAFMHVVADPSATTELYAVAAALPYNLGGPDLTSVLALARRRHRPLWEILRELDEQPGLLRLSVGSRQAIGRLLADVSAAIELSHVRSAGEVLYDFLRRSGRLARMAAEPVSDADAAAAADMVRFFQAVREQSRLLGDDRVAILIPHLAELLLAGERYDEGQSLGDDDAVTVLTVHRAKGLEFPVVYLCGLVDGRFPMRGRTPTLALPDELRGAPVDGLDELAEERRLCYVGMTRARDELVLSYALDGGAGRTLRRVSPFVAEAIDVPATSLPAVRQPAAMPILGEVCDPGTPPVAPVARRPPVEGPLSLSFSGLEDYLSCPARYRLRHVVGVPSPPHHALVYGSALHQAVAAFHLRQARGELLSEEELFDVFARHWTAEGFLSRAHEEARFEAGRDALRRFRLAQVESEAGPPTAIERPFTFTLGTDQIRGRMDRVDETPAGAVITDYKSADVRDQRKADQRARDSLQLQVYALAHEAETGRLPSRIQLHFLDGGVVGSATPTRAGLERTTERIARAASGIRAGRFDAKPNPVACGYCPYRTVCPQSAA